MPQVITQGTSRTISIAGIVDDNDAPLDVTGWAVHAVLRRSAPTGPAVGEWSSTPTGSQGTASALGTTVTLFVTPGMSTAWTWTRGFLQATLTEPGLDGRVERILDELVYLDPDITVIV